MSRIKAVGENLSEQERVSFINNLYQNTDDDVDFELFLKVYLKLQTFASSRTGSTAKNSSAFLKAATTTLLHTISESEKASYVAHIPNNYLLGRDEFLNKYLPIDPSTNDLFEIAKDGVLVCKLINVAVPGTIDERAINTKRLLNPWERNENHTLCLNSAKAIGCTVVNIGTQDLIEGRICLHWATKELLIRGGDVLQRLANINYIALDKTGTLTKGKPVASAVSSMNYGELEILQIAAAVEKTASHPITKAIILENKRCETEPYTYSFQV